MKILQLNPSHIPQVVAIETASHLTPWSEKTIERSFAKRNINYGIFKSSKGFDQMLGYYFSEFVAGEMSLENICIDSQAQGKGLGKALMLHLIEQAQSLQAEQIWLEVRASNHSAIALYQNCGFVETGIRKDYYKMPETGEREDAIMMCLQLSEHLQSA